MSKGRCIGLVGGLGVGATVYYYKSLVAAHQRLNMSLDLTMVHAETSEVFRYAAANDRVGLANYLLGYLQRLAAAGASIAAIPAVTPHLCIHELAAVSPIQLVDIFGPITEALARQSMRKVCVFGTRYVMESDLFGLLPGVEFVHCSPDELDEVHRIYSNLAESGTGDDSMRTRLTAIAQTLCKKNYAECILLAGTDFTLLFNESNTEFPAIDCAALHVAAIAIAACD